MNSIATRVIVVTGGVCSSIGKGVLTASIGTLLQNAGYTVTVMKWDPYLNVDPGTMSPLEHGEVFVTDDGAETDLDLGHYERTLDIRLSKDSSITSGKVYEKLLSDERQGAHLGKCITVIPHVTDEIKKRVLSFISQHAADFLLVEIGGTVGDIEGEIFLEALRQLKYELGNDHVMHCHLSLLPHLPWANEIKKKPTQHSVAQLKRAGLVPDMLVLRTELSLPEKDKHKLALLCGVSPRAVFEMKTYTPQYRLFANLNEQGLALEIQRYFGFKLPAHPDLSSWELFIDKINTAKDEVHIGVIAKYVGSNDPYISIERALCNAGFHHGRKVVIHTLLADEVVEKSSSETLRAFDGILIPGGFGKRSAEGKIAAIQYAREHGVPCLGICLGMQLMLIESARSLLGLTDASSTEFDPDTAHPIIDVMDSQKGVTEKGGTMRLGAYDCQITPGTKAYDAYGAGLISERHRHRFECNNNYVAQLESVGVVFSGRHPELNLVEIIEHKDHPFMVGVQFHPEFTARPLKSHPLFDAFIQAIIDRKE